MMKKDLGRGTQALRELVDSLDILDTRELPDSLDMKNERRNRGLCWRSRLPVNSVGSVDESVELVVPPSTNVSRLLRCMGQLYERLHDADNYGSIMRTVSSWGGGTAITILIQPTKLSSLVIKLANMPEVDKVEEEPLARGVFSSFPDKFGALPTSSISPGKRIHLTLKETDMAG